MIRVPAGLSEGWAPRVRNGWLPYPDSSPSARRSGDLALEAPFETPRSLVVPAGDVVLKLNAPSHDEADHEADALLAWAGRGAARLVARDDERRALLVERCLPGTHLAAPASTSPPSSPSCSHGSRSRCRDRIHSGCWRTRQTAGRRRSPPAYGIGGRPFERSLLAFAVDVFVGVDRSAAFLVNQDLHGFNILRATREPWLAIDPKPLVGEREMDAVGLLRNAAFDGGSALVRRWLDVLEECSLDRDRAHAWGVAHALAWGWTERDGWSARSIDAARAIHAAA